jgi:hypothetical protein
LVNVLELQADEQQKSRLLKTLPKPVAPVSIWRRDSRLQPRTAGREVACKLHTALPKIVPFAEIRDLLLILLTEDSRYAAHFTRRRFTPRRPFRSSKLLATQLISLAEDSRYAARFAREVLR